MSGEQLLRDLVIAFERHFVRAAEVTPSDRLPIGVHQDPVRLPAPNELLDRTQLLGTHPFLVRETASDRSAFDDLTTELNRPNWKRPTG